MVIIKKCLFCLSFLLVFLGFSQKLEAQKIDSSVIQFYGVVLSADSLQPVPAATIAVKEKGRGTIANGDGVFSIVVEKGDIITISSIGYKPKTIQIPYQLPSKLYNTIQVLSYDTSYLPATIVRNRVTKEQFERDFVNTEVDNDLYEIARQNLSPESRNALLNSLPMDGTESHKMIVQTQVNKNYTQGQYPVMNILNPMAWVEFIKSWKRGDYKKKKK